jgi:hypothetical protein
MIDADRRSSKDTDEPPHARVLVGQETPPCESPCPGCGAYFFAPHDDGCGYEQCSRCGAPLVDCGGVHEAGGER